MHKEIFVQLAKCFSPEKPTFATKKSFQLLINHSDVLILHVHCPKKGHTHIKMIL